MVKPETPLVELDKPLTAAAAFKLKPGRKRRIIRDGGARSLFLVIAPSGHKSWQMRFRTPSARIGKLTLGPLDLSGRELTDQPTVGMLLSIAAARQVAAQVHRERALGRDPVADHKARKHRQRTEIKEHGATTFGACVRQFLVEHKVKKSADAPKAMARDSTLVGPHLLARQRPSKDWAGGD